MAVTLADLTTMSQAELDDLFRRSEMGEVPDGDAVGTAIVAPGTELEAPILWFVRWLAWRGKVFDRRRATLLNKVGPFGLRAVRASVYVAPSWLDGRPTIVLDYSRTSLVASMIRDEIREVAPGVYLGVVYFGKQKTINFVLELPRGGVRAAGDACLHRVVTQTSVAAIAEILPGHETAAREQLERLGQGALTEDRFGFRRLSTVHFARFFVLPAATDPLGQPLPARLVFLADVDGASGPFLAAVCAHAADDLDALYVHCRGYPGRAGLPGFMHGQLAPVAARYTNTIGRTVRQIHREAALREAIEGFLDRTAGQWRGADARRVRGAVQAFVRSDPALAWACEPPSGPDLLHLAREGAHFLLGLAAVLFSLPAITAGLPVWLYLLRRHEEADVARDVVPDDAWVQALAAQQDNQVQNPFTSAGFLKPGLFRRFTASVVLIGTDFLTRHVFNHADLLGVKTIHFAEWIFVDDKRRVVFTSNYDGSLESYMDDFVDKIAWGLNATFSNGVDYPKTRWLVLDGAHDEQTFKRFNLTHQLLTQYWFAAYPNLTALNLENNAKIRAGLVGPMDEAAARAWLRRF